MYIHEKVVNARERGLPGKLAEMGALCVAVGAGIWAAHHGRMIVGSAVVMFILYTFILQIICRLVFLAISLITLPAYKIYKKRTQYRGWYKERDSEDSDRRSDHQSTQKNYYEYHSESKHNRQSEQSSDSKREEYHATGNDNNVSEDKARALLGLDEVFTIEELREARNGALKIWHPDQNTNGDQTEVYEEMTKKINEAYKILEMRA